MFAFPKQDLFIGGPDIEGVGVKNGRGLSCGGDSAGGPPEERGSEVTDLGTGAAGGQGPACIVQGSLERSLLRGHLGQFEERHSLPGRAPSRPLESVCRLRRPAEAAQSHAEIIMGLAVFGPRVVRGQSGHGGPRAVLAAFAIHAALQIEDAQGRMGSDIRRVAAQGFFIVGVWLEGRAAAGCASGVPTSCPRIPLPQVQSFLPGTTWWSPTKTTPALRPWS